MSDSEKDRELARLAMVDIGRWLESLDGWPDSEARWRREVRKNARPMTEPVMAGLPAEIIELRQRMTSLEQAFGKPLDALEQPGPRK
jgi:hypothetical protein